ncbi:peptidylprolyl isomerase [Rugamonas sp.]|uniref:peptidylprolyl isomerase n=1 Tax=Rugamonas sp. TaxID=1926287 RepID=UPI0025FF2C9B|nr:peptidylprolyl isomerase [Rugamonas sp.]
MQDTTQRRLPRPSLTARFLALCAGVAISAAAAAAAVPHPAAAADAAPQVALKTTMGDIVVELNHDKAPKSVDNFLQYVKSGYYKNTIFHRVIDGFMIQGGGFDKNLKQKPTRKAIAGESQNGLKNDTYTIAMARTSDPNSATSQFFINVADNGALDYPGQDGYGYTVFGKVIKGQDVVDKIKGVLVDDKGMFQNLPVTPITITAVTVLKTPIAPTPVK